MCMYAGKTFIVVLTVVLPSVLHSSKFSMLFVIRIICLSAIGHSADAHLSVLAIVYALVTFGED